MAAPDVRLDSPGAPLWPWAPGGFDTWRSRKLAAYPQRPAIVPIGDPLAPSEAEATAIAASVAAANMAIYQWPVDFPASGDALLRFASSLGLHQVDNHLCARDDGVAEIQVKTDRVAGEYIPYTARAINWHTDGYYNTAATRVRAFVLHCRRPAAKGGDNRVLDHEMALLRLYQRDPELARVLTQCQAMTVPANRSNGRELRPDRTGPVFSTDTNGILHMRYTARTRSIVWRDDHRVRAAANALSDILTDPDTPVWSIRLAAGQGLICNNVLHSRDAFEDHPDKPRDLLRIRYFDRIAPLTH